MLPSTPEFAILYYGILRAGAIVVCQVPGLMETGLVGFQGCGDRVGHRV
jgi:acyl-CoA synthetase (AMP-forming)/AMP-acid ligase II